MKTKLFLIITAIHILFLSNAYTQITNQSNQATISNPEFVGWDGTGNYSKDLDIMNKFTTTNFNRNINFWTNNGTTATKKMTILGTNGNDDGYVGIGIGFNPSFLFDVNGTININDPLTGYHINGNELLKYHGNTNSNYTQSTTNILVGKEIIYTKKTSGAFLFAPEVSYRSSSLKSKCLY